MSLSAEALAKVGSRAPPPLRYGGPARMHEHFIAGSGPSGEGPSGRRSRDLGIFRDQRHFESHYRPNIFPNLGPARTDTNP